MKHTSRRLAAWRVVAGIAVLAACLGALEAATHLILKDSPPGPIVPEVNPAQRRFLDSLDRLPPDWPFHGRRKSGAVRVVLLGESTPGMPQFEKALRGALNSWRPGIRWEVGRAAIGGNDVESTEALLRLALRYSPDIVVLYFGHNAAFRFPRAFMRWYPLLKALDRSYLLREAWSRGVALRNRFLPETAPVLPPAQRLKEAFLRICRECRRKGVVLLMCVPSGNPSYPPARDDRFSEDTKLARAFGRAMFLEEEERWGPAREAFSLIVARHPGLAEAHFGLGRALSHLGLWRRARLELIQAEDCDSRPSRATSAVRGAIREAARRCACPVVDAENALARRALHGISGAEQFMDNCHPRDGQFAPIAAEVVKALAASPAVEAELGAATTRRGPRLLRTRPAAQLFGRLSKDRSYAYAFAMGNGHPGDQPDLAVVRYFLRDGFSLAPSTFSAMIEDAGPREIASFAAATRRDDPGEGGYEKIRRLVWIEAAIAARRQGLGDLSRRFLDDALRPGAGAREQAMAEVQKAVGDSLAGRKSSARKRRLKAAALWPPIRSDPWFYCGP